MGIIRELAISQQQGPLLSASRLARPSFGVAPASSPTLPLLLSKVRVSGDPTAMHSKLIHLHVPGIHVISLDACKRLGVYLYVPRGPQLRPRSKRRLISC